MQVSTGSGVGHLVLLRNIRAGPYLLNLSVILGRYCHVSCRRAAIVCVLVSGGGVRCGRAEGVCDKLDHRRRIHRMHVLSEAAAQRVVALRLPYCRAVAEAARARVGRVGPSARLVGVPFWRRRGSVCVSWRVCTNNVQHNNTHTYTIHTHTLYPRHTSTTLHTLALSLSLSLSLSPSPSPPLPLPLPLIASTFT